MSTRELPRLTFRQRAAWWIARQNPHAFLRSLLVAVEALNFVGSVVVPYLWYTQVTLGTWEAEAAGCAPPCLEPIPPAMVWDSLLHEFRLDAILSLAGVNLVLEPISWFLTLGIHGAPWQPFVWFGAVGLMAFVASVSTRLASGWRLLYVTVAGLEASGFLAYWWLTLGD